MGDGLDLRRTDLRTNVLENPYWITSKEMTPDAQNMHAVFFSFPITATDWSPGYGDSVILIHQFILETCTAFANGTVAFSIGNCELASDVITGSSDVSDVDVLMYWEAIDGKADIEATGFHFPTTAGAYLDAMTAGTWGTDASIVPDDTTVLCIVGIITSSGTLATGSAYLHALISVVPTVT